MKRNYIILALLILGVCIVGISAASATDVNTPAVQSNENFLGYIHLYVDHNGQPSNYPYIKVTNPNGGTEPLNQLCDGEYIIEGIIFGNYDVHVYDQNWQHEKVYHIPWYEDSLTINV